MNHSIAELISKKNPPPLLTIQPGLIVALCDSPEAMKHARLALTDQFLGAYDGTGLNYPVVDVVNSIYCGIKDENFLSAITEHQTKISESLDGPYPGILMNTFISSEFDFFGTKGQKFVLSNLLNKNQNSYSNVLIFSEYFEKKTDYENLINTLEKIRAAAILSNSYVLIFLASFRFISEKENKTDPPELNVLPDICDELFFIERCESYSDKKCAIGVDCFSLSFLNRKGLEKTTCSVSASGLMKIKRYSYT